MRTLQLSLALLTCIITSCSNKAKSSTTDNTPSATQQTLNITVDGKKKTVIINDAPKDVLSSNYGQDKSIFTLSAMSEQQDFQLNINVPLTSLAAGTYPVYAPEFASSSNPNNYPSGTGVIYGLYPTASPDVTQSGMAYYNPQLNLHPVTLTITAVTDEQWPGNPYKTKRIKGRFSGVLANAEGSGAHWVVKSTKTIEGDFDVYCIIR